MKASRVVAVVWCALVPWAGAWADEGELGAVLSHLRPGEKARLEQALGPAAFHPLYRVELELDPAARKAMGRVQVEVTVGKPTAALYLHARPNAFVPNAVALSGAMAQGKPAALTRRSPSVYRVELPALVPPGTRVRVEVNVKAQAPLQPEDAGELNPLALLAPKSRGKSDHGAFSATRNFLQLVGVVPVLPASEEGAEDEPPGVGDLGTSVPAGVLASITAPAGWRVMATGRNLGEVPGRDGRVRYTFAAAGVREFPVFAARGYERTALERDGVELEVFHAPGGHGEELLTHAMTSLQQLEPKLGPYPWTALKVVEAPLTDGAGGMEFCGLITVASSLTGSGGGGLAAMGLPGLEGMVEFTVAHEVGHQYFAGLVGSDPLRHGVVDEAITQYAALLVLEGAHGRKVADGAREQQMRAAWHAQRMMGGADAPADRPSGSYKSEGEYAAAVYAKAPFLYDAQRELVGDATFFKGLRSYVDTYRYRWAGPRSFTEILQKLSAGNAAKLESLRKRWMDEAHGEEDLGSSALGNIPGMGKLPGGMPAQGLDPASLEALQQMLKEMGIE
jgi:hypothetical protein